jgi:hypothetical protein
VSLYLLQRMVHIFEIVDIFYRSNLLSRCGCSIEQPAQGAQVSSGSLDLAGWVLGRQHPAVAVEVVHEGVALRRVSLNLSRPDVAAAFPQVPGAERSGFRTTLSLSTSKPELELLQAVLRTRPHAPGRDSRSSPLSDVMSMKSRHARTVAAREPAVTVNSVTTNSGISGLVLAGSANRSLSISGLPDELPSDGIHLTLSSYGEAMSDPWSLCVTSNHFAEHLETLRRYANHKTRGVSRGSKNIALPDGR